MVGRVAAPAAGPRVSRRQAGVTISAPSRAASRRADRDETSIGSTYGRGYEALQRETFQESSESSRNPRVLVYPLGMRGRVPLAAVLVVLVIVLAIRCAGLGVVNVGSIVPPMPLKTTPEGYDDPPAPRATRTATPWPTRTLTPTPSSPTPGPGDPEPLPEPPPVMEPMPQGG